MREFSLLDLRKQWEKQIVRNKKNGHEWAALSIFTHLFFVCTSVGEIFRSTDDKQNVSDERAVEMSIDWLSEHVVFNVPITLLAVEYLLEIGMVEGLHLPKNGLDIVLPSIKKTYNGEIE